MSERKLDFGEISENRLIDKMKRGGFSEAEITYLKENWDEIIQEVIHQSYFQSDVPKKAYLNVLSTIGKRMKKDDFFIKIEETIGIAIKSIQKLRDSAPDGSHAFLITTESIEVVDGADWELDPEYWIDVLDYHFQLTECPYNFINDAVRIIRDKNGISIEFIIY